MEIFVTAIFSSEDSADLAHARLSRQGVRMSRYEVFPMHRAQAEDDLRLVVDPYNSMTAQSIDEAAGAQSGVMGQFGGFLYLHGRGENSASVVGYDGGESHRSGDVLVRLLVNEYDVEMCKAVLTSEHASHVRIG